MKPHQYRSGLTIIEGLMGSGKSLFAVEEIDKSARQERRPIYTNLPLRWRVYRKYLRIIGGEQLANQIHKLDEKHWRAFLVRQLAWRNFYEHHKNIRPYSLDDADIEYLSSVSDLGRTPEAIRKQDRVYPAQWEALFDRDNGEPIYEGEQANAIPQNAIIVIDEIQQWHPMSKQATDPQSDALLAYLTMIRHHVHYLYVITQDRTRININFRNLMQQHWKVTNIGERKVFWRVQFKHIGINFILYVRRTREQLDLYESGRTAQDAAKARGNPVFTSRAPQKAALFQVL